jgi:hypothetical protein
MGNGSINRESSSPPEELSFRAQEAWAAISLDSVNGMIESDSSRICLMLALRQQSLNDHPNVMRDLQPGGRTSEAMNGASQIQAESLRRLGERSQELFVAGSLRDQRRSYHQ